MGSGGLLSGLPVQGHYASILPLNRREPSRPSSLSMRNWLVAPGPASTELALSLAKLLKADVVDVQAKIFPDGESKLRIRSLVQDRPVILVQSMYPPVDRHLIQALFLAHKLSEEGAEVHALMPYLGYARQDKEFLPGEVVSLGVVVRLLRSSGIKRLVTVDIHGVEGLGLFSFPAYSVSAIPQLAEHFARHFELRDPIAVSPDLGASTRVEAFAKVLGCEYIGFQKQRDRETGEVTIEERPLNVKGRDVVVVDDILSTGETIQKASALLKKHGAYAIYAGCVHPVLVGDALEKIKAAGVEAAVATNTIPSPISVIDVCPMLVDYFSSL